MAIAPWLQPIDFLGAIRSGAGLGLQARAQDEAEQRAADQLALSRDELQARREQHAASLAESLRQHNALEIYRQQEVAHQKALENQAAAALLNTELNQAANLALGKRREDRLQKQAEEARSFTPGEPVPIMVPGSDKPVGYRLQRSPNVWEQLRQQKPTRTEMTIGEQLRLGQQLGSPNLLIKSNPFYGAYTNLLNRLTSELPQAGGKGPKKGMVEDGYRLVGDDPADPDSWEEVDE